MPVAFGATGMLIMRSSLREAFAAAFRTSSVLPTAVLFALGWAWQRYTAHVDDRFNKVERQLDELELKAERLERSAKEVAKKHNDT